MYQNFDALDGKQARKLGLASPLGQLFDHGIDCCLTTVYIMNFMIMFKIGTSPFIFLYVLMVNFIIFYFPNWAEFFTHVLRTNSNNVGVTEIHLTVILMNLATWLWGDVLWQKTSLFGLSTINLFALFLFIAILINIPPLFVESWKAAEGKDKEKYFTMLIPIASFFASLILAYIMIPQVFAVPKVSVVLMFCFTFNILTIKMITGSLTRMDYDIVHLEVIALYITIFLISIGFSQNLICLHALLVFSRLIHLAVCIIQDISIYLKINVLWVPK